MATEVYKEKVTQDPSGHAIYREQVVKRSPPTEIRRSNAGTRILYYVLDLVEVLLALRFLLALFGANPAAPFVTFIYNITAPFVAPFRGIFASYYSGAYFDWAAIIAMAVYALVVYAIVRLVEISYEA